LKWEILLKFFKLERAKESYDNILNIQFFGMR
jgi:hypothetical protein